MIKRFLKMTSKHPEMVTTPDVRCYLSRLSYLKPEVYASHIKSLRRFYRDFLARPEVVASFRFPSRTYEPKILPNKDHLRIFYEMLPTIKLKAFFLTACSSGLRKCELLSLTIDDIDTTKRMIIPRNGHDTSTSKRSWLSFYNQECEQALQTYLPTRAKDDSRLFQINERNLRDAFTRVSKNTGIRLSPQTLREWFCQTMGELGIPDRFIDAFCGRTPKSILARHYSDYSPERLKRIYDQAGLNILS
jgi:integrase